ncbi:AIPR protein [Saprospira grandis DSM 2844]|uniref:AIPR protein n=1 Tax=Saprospira grandis DSM 2844 TaxID=694433 RepID=J0NX16_9BACT|nr:AIPR family protein [Saprospira grandis]EJF52044.1 AIPR protein [Saprospira grandis DSM 2844]
MQQENYDFLQNLTNRSDLDRYGDNKHLLYSLQLKYSIEDIHSVASIALVDGPNDKKTDLLYIDDELGEAVIAQGYFSKKEGRTHAPANKASDLNTSVSWLLTRNLEDLPEALRSAAKELREKIKNNEISRITLWYCHNRSESTNVEQELTSAENTLSSILKNHFSDKTIDVHSLEVGLKKTEEWYKELTVPILMTDDITLDNCTGFENSGTDWSSFSTSFPANKLYDLYKKYDTSLFSANVRDYLGSRNSSANINNGIKETAKDDSEHFFVYNNGITALVNNFQYNAKTKKLTIEGLSIVNGAQTTGAIGTLDTSPDKEMTVPIRLIKCANQKTVQLIVKYNNSQNKITAPDFRSSDSIQKRITKEFQKLQLEYSPRRGNATDIITRSPNLLPSISAGQVLAAFHGEPSIAYNSKSKIWTSDSLYSKFFNTQTTAKHIFFCYSLLKAIEDLKFELASSTAELLEQQKTTLNFLRSRGAIVLFTTAISDCLETIVNRKVSNNFKLKFSSNNLTLEEAKKAWREIIDIVSPFVGNLNEGLKDGIKNKESIDKAKETFKQLVQAIRTANKDKMDDFASKVSS